MEKRKIYETPESEVVVYNLDDIRMVTIESNTDGTDGRDEWEFDEDENF